MHVDVIALEPDDRASIKIDVVRDVLTRTGYRPFEGKRRVVLIREADTLEDVGPELAAEESSKSRRQARSSS